MRVCTCERGIAVVIIAGPNRWETTLPEVVRSVREQDPDEIVLVGEGWEWPRDFGVPYLNVAPLAHSTIDALVKRDAGTVATSSPNICYLADDHILAPGFIQTFREKYEDMEWDLLAPSRFTIRSTSLFPLNVGEKEAYIGGHCGIYRREILRRVPWTSTRHHPNWDVWHSHDLVKAGGRLVYAGTDLAVEDIEPGAKPWM